MKNKISYLIATAAVAGLAQMASATPSSPSIQVSLDGTTWITVGTAVGGSISTGPFTEGGFTITSLSGQISGSASSPVLDLDTLDLSGVGTLYVELSATGFGPSSGGFIGSIGGNLGADTLVWSAYASAANTLFGGSTIFSASGLTGNGFNGAASGSVGALSSPYSLTEEYVITSAAGNVTDSIDGQINTVPDGGTTVMLLGSALSGLALLKRKLVA